VTYSYEICSNEIAAAVSMYGKPNTSILC